MNYFIAVEVEANGPITDLAAALQHAYDGGAAGDFQVLVTHAPTYMVVFSRSAETDAEFVSLSASNPDVSIETAAMQQLAAELEAGGARTVALPVIDALREGDAQCFDFSKGAMEMLAAWKPDQLHEA